MNKIHRSFFIRGLHLSFSCAVLGAGVVAYSAESKPPAREQGFEERYKVIWEQNMFVKDRRRPYSPSIRGGGSGGGPGGDGRPFRAPETLFALRGVVLEEGQFRAYLEDISNGKMLRLNVGDPIAKGHIAEIDIDAIAYESNGQITWVNVGTDLRGQVAILTSSASESPRVATTRPSTTAASDTTEGAATSDGAGAAADPATMSIEEKMRQRRLQGK